MIYYQWVEIIIRKIYVPLFIIMDVLNLTKLLNPSGLKHNLLPHLHSTATSGLGRQREEASCCHSSHPLFCPVFLPVPAQPQGVTTLHRVSGRAKAPALQECGHSGSWTAQPTHGDHNKDTCFTTCEYETKEKTTTVFKNWSVCLRQQTAVVKLVLQDWGIWTSLGPVSLNTVSSGRD